MAHHPEEPLLFFDSDSGGETEELISRRRKRREQQFTPHFREQIDGGQSRFQCEVDGESVTVNLDYLKHGTGSSVWDSAIVLMKLFENKGMFPKGYWKGKRVLEIGAGTGIVGLMTAKLGADSVVLTDLQELLETLKINVVGNGLQSKISVVEHRWGTPVDVLGAPFDVIVCADCILPYAVDAMPALCHTLSELCRAKEQAIAYMAYEERFDASHFFTLAEGAGLRVDEIPVTEHHEIFRSDLIHVYRITYKGNSSS